MRSGTRLVWDLPLRIFHWLFAVSIVAAWATAKLGFAWMQWHFWIGYEVMALLVFRILWGFVGPRHSRFSNFLKGPVAVVRYLRGFSTHVSEGPVGHNPLGAFMVVFMLLLAATQAVTGLFATDDIAWAGPYSGAVTDATAKQLTALHHFTFDFMWAAMALHITAILYYARVKKISLVPAMLTGRKPAAMVPAIEEIENSQLWKAAIVLALSLAILYAVLRAAPPASSTFY